MGTHSLLSHATHTAAGAVGYAARTGATVVGRTVGFARGLAGAVLESSTQVRRPDRAEQVPEALRRDAATRAPRPTPPTAPRTAREPDEEIITPAGVPAADAASNPDTAETDLHQPGTEPLVSPGTAKSVRKESETLQRAARRDKE